MEMKYVQNIVIITLKGKCVTYLEWFVAVLVAVSLSTNSFMT